MLDTGQRSRLLPRTIRLLSTAAPTYIVVATLASATLAHAQTYRRVSEASDGTQANGASVLAFDSVAVSENGRWVAFASAATNLVPGDANESVDVFVKDLDTGAISRVSVGPGGAEQTGDSGLEGLDISDDGQIVAFSSRAALVANDTNECDAAEVGPCPDVYVHNRTTGETTRASVSSLGVQGDDLSHTPRLSADGRYVVFASLASTLVDGDTNGVEDVFLHDRTTQTTTRVSVSSTGVQGNNPSTRPDISGDGLIVGFVSRATTLVDTVDPLPCAAGSPPCERVFTYERDTAVLARVDIERPSFITQVPASDITGIRQIRLDAHGRWLAIEVRIGFASPVLAPLGPLYTSVLFDRSTGRHFLALSNQSPQQHPDTTLDISPNGGTVTNLVVAGVGSPPATTLFERHTGLSHAQPAGRLALNGKLSAFPSADALIPADTNAVADVYVFDRDGGDHDTIPDDWETQYGLDPSNAADAVADPDNDGMTSVQEYLAGTHPNGGEKRYFAEGSASAFFKTRFAILNPNDTAASIVLNFQGSEGGSSTRTLTVGANQRATVLLDQVSNLPSNDFSTLVESNVPLVMDRTMTWDATGYGAHTETSIAAPSTTWHLAEGATHGGFDLFYLFQNPNDVAATVTVTYLRKADTPVVRTYDVAPRQRRTIHVDTEGAELEAVEVGASITSNVPIVVERAMYVSTPDQPLAGGHVGAGITQPALTWFLAEGATGDFFDLYILVGNPDPAPAELTVSYLLPSGERFSKPYTVGAQQRLTISVQGEDPRLAGTAVAAIVESTNSQPVIVERAMWWPKSGWLEGHLSAGTTETGTRWAIADGESGESLLNLPDDRITDTFILIANTGPTDGQVTVTTLVGAGDAHETTIAVAANTRLSVNARDVLEPRDGLFNFSAIIESDGVPIVVERATYSTVGGVFWQAGSSAVATKLDPPTP